MPKKSKAAKPKAKKTAKRAAKKFAKPKIAKKAVKAPKAAAKKTAKPVGKITHFYPNISVAVVDVLATIKQGDKIKIEGHGRSFEQKVASMQIEHAQIKEAKKGQSIGMKVAQEAKEGDLIYPA